LGLRKRVALIADTNFLMLIPQGAVTPTHILEALERSYEIIVPETVIEELRFLAEQAPQAKTRRLAARTLLALERGVLDYRVLPAVGETDDSIVMLAKRLASEGRTVVVATNDKALRRRLRMLGVPTLYLRESESKLEVDWLEP